MEKKEAVWVEELRHCISREPQIIKFIYHILTMSTKVLQLSMLVAMIFLPKNGVSSHN